jgi:ATP-dependent helicase/nuclease subunit A
VSDATTIYAFRRDLVLAASAGTGKTHSLVGVLVHLLLGASELSSSPVDPGRVLATTFSRKAAAEIRARIAVALERLAGSDDSAPYRLDLDAACDRAGRPRWDGAEVATRAREVLASIGRAKIGTLHGFASSLLRSYALERGLSPSFEIADEDVARLRLEDGISRAIERLATTRGKELAELVRIAGDVERLASQLALALSRLEEEGRDAASLAVDPSDADAIDGQMRRTVDHARALARLPRFEAAAGALVQAWEGRDADAMADAAESFCGLRAAKDGPAAESWFAFREASLPGKTNAERGRSLALRWRLRDRFAATATFERELLAACEEETRRDAARSGALTYGDLLRRARDLLLDRPDLAAEIGASLDVALIDELQDTSRLQRDMLLLLWQRDPGARAPGAMPGFAQIRPKGLLVVGDRKQSIYAFRGADVSVFAEVCVGLAGAPARRALGIEAGRTWEPEEPIADFVPLRHNRRGEPELLTFANEFSARRFAPGDPVELYEIAYVPPTEDLRPPPERPPVLEPTPRTTWLRVALGDGRVSQPMDEAAVIAERVEAIVAYGELRVKGEPPRWRDVAVLAETNRALDHVAHALARAEVPYVVAGSGFYNAREVRDLAAMLAVLIDPREQWALVEVLRGPWCGVRDETLLALTDEQRGIAPAGAWNEGARRGAVHPDDRGPVGELSRVVLALHEDIDRVGPGGALREAVRALELEEVLVRLPRGAQRVANVRKLLAIADRARDASALLESLDEAAEREISEGEAATFSEEDDAVRLLTVHASKGLDFPIVILPEVGKAPRPVPGPAFRVTSGDTRDGGGVLVTKIVDDEGRVHEGPSYVRALDDARRRDRAERQRLAYVAATRASHAMFFVGDRVASERAETDATTTAGVLRALASDEPTRARAMLLVEDVKPDLARARVPMAVRAEPEPAWAEAVPRWRSLPIAPAALEDFAHCARRFQLGHLERMPELDPRGERAVEALLPRVLARVDLASFGAPLLAPAEAARALAREGVTRDHPLHGPAAERLVAFLLGAYATKVASARAQVSRAVPLVHDVGDAAACVVTLTGTIDLLVRWKDGAVDVVDATCTRGSPVTHALRLVARVLAARALVPEATRIRAGHAFLGGGGEPAWYALGAADLDAARARTAALGERLALARWSERFPPEPVTTCHAIDCGYLGFCHADGARPARGASKP